MPRKKRINDNHAGFEVEMTIPVTHTRRARTLEERLGPAKPPEPPQAGPRIPRITRKRQTNSIFPRFTNG